MNEFPDSSYTITYHENLYDEYPYIPDIFYSLVQAYAKGDHYAEARESLELWLSSHPNDSQAIDWLSILSIKE